MWRVMEKCVFFRADIDKRRLQRRFQTGDLPEINRTGQNVISAPFDFIFIQTPVLEHCEACFELFAIDNDLFFVFCHSSFLI